MMLGIRMAVKSVFMENDYKITPKDFKVKFYFELLPKRTGNEKSTLKICKFFDYAPHVIPYH